MNRIGDLEGRVGPATVGLGDYTYGGNGRLHEVGTESERNATFCKLLTPPRAILEHRGQIGLEHGGHVWRGVQKALHYVLGGAAPRGAVRHAPHALLARRRRLRCLLTARRELPAAWPLPGC